LHLINFECAIRVGGKKVTRVMAKRTKVRKLTTRRSLTPGQLAGVGRDALIAWSNDGAPSMGAAIAYYTIFSIAPLLVIAIAIAGFFLGVEAAHGRIFTEVNRLVGAEGAAAIEGLVQSAGEGANGIVGGFLATIVLLFGATGVFAELQSSIDRIWRAPVQLKVTGIWSLIRRRLFTFGMVLAVAFLLLVSLVISAAISSLQAFLTGEEVRLEAAIQVINFVTSFAIIAALFASIFKLLPRVSVAWGDVVVGAVITALLFNLGKLFIGLYIGKSGLVSGFGAAGSLVAILVWIYYSAQIFLLGAEFTWIYANKFGSRSTL
jgi:membrane protein